MNSYHILLHIELVFWWEISNNNFPWSDEEAEHWGADEVLGALQRSVAVSYWIVHVHAHPVSVCEL